MGKTFYFDFEPVMMEWIQSHMGEIGKYLSIFFTYFGEIATLVVILIFIYWCYDKEFGKKIGTNIVVGITINPMIKNIFFRRRPYFDHKNIECLKRVDGSSDAMDINAQGYSFPSGHSTNSVIVYGTIAVEKKKRYLKIIAVVLPLLVGLSRVALGVHYPTDVLCGYLLGILSMLFTALMEKLIKSDALRFTVISLLMFPGFIYCDVNDYFTAYGVMIGFFAAVLFEKKYVRFENTRDPLLCFLRVAIGLGLYGVMSFLFKLPFGDEINHGTDLTAHIVRTARYAVMVFLLCGVYPKIFPLFDKVKTGKNG